MTVFAHEAAASVFDKNRRIRTMVPAQLIKSQAPWYVHNIYDMKPLLSWIAQNLHVPHVPRARSM